MATTFLFEFNWSGDGPTWADESANVFAAQNRFPTGDPVLQVGLCIHET